jgi:hypothetical protein
LGPFVLSVTQPFKETRRYFCIPYDYGSLLPLYGGMNFLSTSHFLWTILSPAVYRNCFYSGEMCSWQARCQNVFVGYFLNQPLTVPTMGSLYLWPNQPIAMQTIVSIIVFKF